jgi:hypothetical protein
MPAGAFPLPAVDRPGLLDALVDRQRQTSVLQFRIEGRRLASRRLRQPLSSGLPFP